MVDFLRVRSSLQFAIQRGSSRTLRPSSGLLIERVLLLVFLLDLLLFSIGFLFRLEMG